MRFDGGIELKRCRDGLRDLGNEPGPVYQTNDLRVWICLGPDSGCLNSLATPRSIRAMRQLRTGTPSNHFLGVEGMELKWRTRVRCPSGHRNSNAAEKYRKSENWTRWIRLFRLHLQS